ncbi:hypothetical protein [Hyphomonas johnsonii]|uniref:Uncharacterized protein n=1 Tax=Hyphomonas johnsonii MHS-2 TaxID=1280950 RepID=A0A059FQV0_9PROT|nr:hypothetical protein [Hyphomonas johnsonii]KCZ92992.1 hypothetical protein HJO_08552 [Hyphomonas johnsonii MHS-2]
MSCSPRRTATRLRQLRDRTPEQINALLSLMEMQTRQNFVSMLSKSGSLVVVSAAEQDMEGNELLADRLRKALEAASDTETDS